MNCNGLNSIRCKWNLINTSHTPIRAMWMNMSLIAHKPIFLVAASTIFLLSAIVSVILSWPSSALGVTSDNSLFPNSPLFTSWINQCVQARIANNNNNNNNLSAASSIVNPTFALAYARAYCTQLLQSYINSNNQQSTTTQNQPSLTTSPPSYSSQSQYPSSYPYQQQLQQPSQPSNTPTQQDPYQSPYQYPYQQQPYPSTNQQPLQPQQQSQTTNSAPTIPQYPYQNSYPYQLLQNQSYGLATNPTQPQSSQSFPTTVQPSESKLTIITKVNGTGGSNNNKIAAAPDPSNSIQIVENAYANPDGYTYVYHYMKGSEAGVTVGLQPGTFGVFELKNNNDNIKANAATSSQSTYDVSYSGDCRTVKSNTGGAAYGYGTINPGETKTCIVTLSLHK
jgi:hypothetical protein